MRGRECERAEAELRRGSAGVWPPLAQGIRMLALLIDGLGYATSTTTVPFSLSRTRAFRQNLPHNFSSPCCAEAVGIAHKPLGSL